MTSRRFTTLAERTVALLLGVATAAGAESSPADTTKSPVIVVYESPEATEEGLSPELREKIFSDPTDIELSYQVEDREGKVLRLDFQPAYDRVDELSLSFTQTLRHARRLTPRLHVVETFSTGRETFLYRLDFEQPLSLEKPISVGFSVFDETAVFIDLIDRVGLAENTMAALFFKEDFRHYFGREGFSLYAEVGLPRLPKVGVTYRDEKHRSLASTTNGSLFRPRTTFRDNPEATTGRLRSWQLDLGYTNRAGDTAPGLIHSHAATFETTGPSLDSDFDFDYWRADSKWILQMGPDQSLLLRLRGGGIIDGELPIQRHFFIGGIGSLRGHDFAAVSGERLLLANLEYAFSVFAGFQAIVFQDIGTAWSRDVDFGDLRPEFDVGLGFRNRTERFRVNFARDLRVEQAPIVATVRISRPF